MNTKERAEQELHRLRSQYADDTLSAATARLSEVGTYMSKFRWDSFDDSNECIEVCKVLCSYLKVEPKIPTGDVAGSLSELAYEILYLSGVRYKDVELRDGWWKNQSGAMLGALCDGTPIAILPAAIRGYIAYNPKTNQTFKVNAKNAHTIHSVATLLFRTLPPEKIGFVGILKFLFGERLHKELLIIVLCSFVASMVSIIPSIVAEQIFDVILPETLRAILFQVIIILIAFECSGVGFDVIINLGITRMNIRGGLAMQAALWDRLLSLRVPFFNKYTTGELLQKLKGFDRATAMISRDNVQVLIDNLFSFIYIIVLFNLNADIAPFVLLMFLCLLAVYLFVGLTNYKLWMRVSNVENRLTSFNHQFIRGIHRIKASCAEERIFNIWSRLESERRSIQSRIKMFENFRSAFQLFFDFASTAVVYLLISSADNVEMGAFVAFLSIFLLFKKSMRKLLKTLSALPEFLSVCKNVEPILNALPEYSADKTIPKDLKGSLEINHATFHYGEYGRTIVNDISFRAEEGESIGIVGPSGCGKSTLLKLLMGFYDLNEGKIFYGGYALETVDMRYLRRHIGVVLQKGGMLVGDIYSVLTGNNPFITVDEVWSSLEKVELADYINSLPNGLHTRLEDISLSDGDRSRLLIARAITGVKKFLLLDEATASLDNASGLRIMRNLKDLPCTKIIVAQRLESVRYCNRIIALDNGRVVATGSYDEVIASKKEVSHEC